MSARALLSLTLLATLSSACAHSVEFRSEPPGAEVWVEGERLGTTPLTWEETTTHEGDVTVSVRRQETEARFALQRKGFAVEPLLAGVGIGAASLVLGLGGIVAGYGLLIGAVLTALAVPLAFGLLAGGAAAIVVAATVLSSAWLWPLVAAGELGRKGPERVLVDFEKGRVSTDPNGFETPLIGATTGFRPLSPPSDGRGLPDLPPAEEHDDDDNEEEAPPPLPAAPRADPGRDVDRQGPPPVAE